MFKKIAIFSLTIFIVVFSGFIILNGINDTKVDAVSYDWWCDTCGGMQTFNVEYSNLGKHSIKCTNCNSVSDEYCSDDYDNPDGVCDICGHTFEKCSVCDGIIYDDTYGTEYCNHELTSIDGCSHCIKCNIFYWAENVYNAILGYCVDSNSDGLCDVCNCEIATYDYCISYDYVDYNDVVTNDRGGDVPTIFEKGKTLRITLKKQGLDIEFNGKDITNGTEIIITCPCDLYYTFWAGDLFLWPTCTECDEPSIQFVTNDDGTHQMKCNSSTCNGRVISSNLDCIDLNNDKKCDLCCDDMRYTVTLDINGATGTTPTVAGKYKIGETVTLPSTVDAVRAGKRFIGWSEISNSNKGYTSRTTSKDYLSNGTFKYYASWVDKYTVSINTNAQNYTIGDNNIKFNITGTTLSNFTVEYKVNNNWTTTVPTAVGKYDVKVTRAEDTDNKEYSNTITNALVINKKNYNMSGVTWNYTNAFTYDGNAKTVTVSNLPNGVTVKNYTNNSKTNAGTFTATVTFNYENSEEYNEPTFNSLTWTINKAANVITVDKTPIVKVFGESITIPTATSINGTVSCDKEATDLVNAGNYTITYTVAASDNYLAANETVSVTVSKKEITIIWDEKSFVHTGNVLTINASYKDINNETVNLNVTTDKEFKDVGSYVATATFANNETNYCLPSAVTKNYTIVEKQTINNKEVTDPAKKPEEGTKVELVSGTLDSGMAISITKKVEAPSQNVIDNIKTKLSETVELLAVFDIHIEDAVGVEVAAPAGNKFKVTLALPEDLVGRTGYAIVYIKDDGDVEKYDAVVDGNTVSFETTHFSTWGIVADEIVENNPTSFWSVLLIIILVLLVAFVALFFVWRYELKKVYKDEERKLKFFDVVFNPVNELYNKLIAKLSKE